jgi:hypothetical protein
MPGGFKMAMVTCGECGKDVSDMSVICIGCGAPVAFVRQDVFGDLDGDGKRTLADIKTAVGILIDKTSSASEIAVDQAREWINIIQKDRKNASSAGDVVTRPIPGTQNALDCSRFVSAMESTIDLKFAGTMERKDKGAEFLTYVDGQIITASVRNIFRNALGMTPPEIDTACKLAEAVVAPSADERQKLVRAAIGIGGGAAGIGMILAAIGTALGWGAGVVAAVTTFFVGTAMAGPIGWMIAGVTLAGVASYFAVSSNQLVRTDKFMKVLKSSTRAATEAIWAAHGDALTKVIESGNRS